MRFKTSISLLTALAISMTFPPLYGGQISPGENPVMFRNSLHEDYSRFENKASLQLPSSGGVNIGFEKGTLNFEDLLISEQVGPANFTQEKADMAALKGGRTVIAWEDDRSGPVGVYLQIFDNSGNAIGDNIAYDHGLGIETGIGDPRLCADTTGHFYLVWRSEADGYIRAQRMDSTAAAVGSVFLVSDTTISSYAGEFDADCLPDGRLLVAWEEYGAVTNVVYQLFTSAGIPSTIKAVANTDGLDVRHWSPAVTADVQGNFAIAWEDYRGGSAEIYFRRFNTLGLAYAAEIALGDAFAPDSARMIPDIAYSSGDGYIVAWVDLRQGQNLYMQQLDNSGSPVNDNVLITGETSDEPNWQVALDINANGNLLAGWAVYGAERRIMLQKFGSGLQFDGLPQPVSSINSNLKYEPSVAGNSGGNTCLAWTDLSPGLGDIFAACVDADGGNIKSEFTVNDDATGSASIEPSAARFDPFEWLVVFTDKRRDEGDIMLQRVYVGGTLVEGNRRINADAPGGFQSGPSVIARNEFALMTWTDERPAFNGSNILAVFARPSYNLTPEIVVNNDSLSFAAHFDSDCAINESSVSLVVWTDTRSGRPQIYGQLFDADFDKRGNNFLIGPAESGQTGEKAVVSVDPSGNFVVACFNAAHDQGPSVEFRQISPTGTITSLFSFTSDQSGLQIDGFDAEVNLSDQVVLVWRGTGLSDSDLFMTAFDKSGTVVSSTSSVLTTPDAIPGIPDADIDNIGYLLVTWLDYGQAPVRPYYQIYYDDLTPLTANTPATTAPIAFAQKPITVGDRGRGLFAWADARQNGLNIYASQEIYEPTDTDEDNATLPQSFSLEQNHPNPFNPSTVIKFALDRDSEIRLDIFNLLGQKVRTLTDNLYPAGQYSLTWDGTDDRGRQVSSGVYLYRLQNENRSLSRKMTLLK